MAKITGVTRDQNGVAIAGATVEAYRTSDKAFVVSAVSDALGAYTLTVPDLGPFYLFTHKDGTPYLAGVSRRDIAAVNDAVATVQSLWTGTPTSDGVVLTAKTINAATSTRVAVSTSSALTNPVYSAAVAPDATYRVARHIVTGKTANTEYWYALEVDGVIDMATKGRFKTLPAAGAANFSIALGGCAENTNDAAFVALNALAQKPLFLLAIGDFQYMDLAEPTTADYHAAFDASLAYGARKTTHSEIPTIYMWDDHDFWTNDATGRDLNNVVKSTRNTALAFFRARVPVITASSVVTDTAHYSFVVGRVRFVVSDLRADKTGLTATDNASKTMMGVDQKAWWKSEIAAAKTAGQMVAWISSVPFVQSVVGSGDQWGSYNTERVELADHIKAQGMAGRVFILSSDMHALAVHSGADYATGGGAAIPVFQAGPFNRAGSTKGGPYTIAPYPGNTTSVQQYGTMDVADDGTTITITWKGYSANGTLRMTHSFTSTPGAVAATAPAKMAAPTAVAGDGQVTLTLVAPNDGGSAITQYQIPNLPAGAVDQQAGTTALTRTITGLANGISRTFTAIAVNAIDSSPASDPSNPVTPVAATPSVFEATGGTITTPGDGFKYWTFLASDTLTVTNAGSVDYLVVAGGGGGGRGSTSGVAGGGAGGVRTGTINLTAIAHAVTVGAGGVGSNATAVGNGADSSIADLVVATGGGGGGYSSTVPGNGGSGGGAGSSSAATAVGTGIAGQGNNGGTANGSATQSERAGGGGGGAGTVGGNAASGIGGNGGDGVTIFGRLLGGGGGGAAQLSTGTQGLGKAGGTDATRGTVSPANATANTGSGGGGHITTNNTGKGGDGGSGIVIIRRPV